MEVPVLYVWADSHVSQFINLIYVFIKTILCWYSQCLWGQIDKAEQVQCLKLHRGVGCGQSAGHMAEESNKLTLRRLEAPIHKFIKVALPTDLERLQKHHNNILKVTAEILLDTWSHPSHPHSYFRSTDGQLILSLLFSQYQHSQQWDRLHHEHINASRTVQV